MKWHAAVTTLLASVQLVIPVGASKTCTTAYASTPTKHVPTAITTKTTIVESTTSVVLTSTETQTFSTVFTITIASATTTVPTGANFTPLISAHSVKPSSRGSRDAVSQRRRAVKPRIQDRNGVRARRSETSSPSKPAYPTKPAHPTPPTYPTPPKYPTPPTYPSKPPPPPPPYPSESFPHSVDCTTSITRTHTSTTTSTFVIGAFAGVTTTVTTHVPTATAYAACGPDNIISTFQGHQLGGYAADHSLGICFTGNGQSGFEPCLSAEACCAAAQNTGYSGWQFTNGTGSANQCTILAGGIAGEGGYVFYSGDGDGHVFFGNAAGGDGVFGGAQT